MPIHEMRPCDVAHAALCEAGRLDLAEIVVWFDEVPDGYLEVMDEICAEADYRVIDRAEYLARLSINPNAEHRDSLSAL